MKHYVQFQLVHGKYYVKDMMRAILTFGTTIPMALEAAETLADKRDSCESC